MADIVSARRRYLSRERESRWLDDGDEKLWRGIRRALPGTPLPGDFPARTLLLAAGYEATEDIIGADSAELTDNGLSAAQANAVLAALE